jgi:hypothetical protein
MPHASGTCSAGLATLRIWSGPKVPGWMPSGPSVSQETGGPTGLTRPVPRHPWPFARSTPGGGRAGTRAPRAGSPPPARATPGRRTGRSANEAYRGRGSAKAGWEGCCSTGRAGGVPSRASRHRSRAGRPHLLPPQARHQAVRPARHQARPASQRAAQPVRHQARPARHRAARPARHRMAQSASHRPVRPARTLDGSPGPRRMRAPGRLIARFHSHPVVGRTRHLAGREPRHLAGSVPGRRGAVAPCPRNGSPPTG